MDDWKMLPMQERVHLDDMSGLWWVSFSKRAKHSESHDVTYCLSHEDIGKPVVEEGDVLAWAKADMEKRGGFDALATVHKPGEMRKVLAAPGYEVV